jgi:uncharacterized membrane protein
MPDHLHWFKWEAYTTWLSGALLLGLIYYVGAGLFLIDKAKLDIPAWQAIAIALAFIVGGWLVYDGLCRSPLGGRLRAFGVVWYLILTAAAFALTRIFEDRAAFIHVGAIVGTVMAANVFFVIIPNQKKAVAAMIAGQAPDPALGKQAKQRSIHNNYMTLPVLLIMVSNHYPMVFGNPLNWLLLSGLGGVGWTIRHFFNLRNSGRNHPEVLVYGALGFAGVVMLSQLAMPFKTTEPTRTSFATAQGIVAKHCLACHSRNPTHSGIFAPPSGAAFDTPEGLIKFAPKIYERAVISTSMPQGNETHMTDAERAALGAWIAAGAPVH